MKLIKGLARLIDETTNIIPNATIRAIEKYSVYNHRGMENISQLMKGYFVGLAAQTAIIGYGISRYTDNPIEITLGTSIAAIIPPFVKTLKDKFESF